MINKFLNKLFVDDALEFLKKLPSNSVDLVITSPPYNKKNNKGWLVDEVRYDKYIDNINEEEYQNWQIQILNELFRVVKEGGHLFYNHKIRWENGIMIHPIYWLSKTKWLIRQEIIWNRKIAGNIRGWRFWQIEERIYWLHKPKDNNFIGEELKSRHAKLTSIWEIRPESGFKEHPAPFPLELPTRIIYSIFDEEKNKVVLDPFCGIGTTLVASKLLGHNYIGVDISSEYIKIAENRLNNANDELPRVLEELRLHKVEKTFKERKDEKNKKQKQISFL